MLWVCRPQITQTGGPRVSFSTGLLCFICLRKRPSAAGQLAKGPGFAGVFAGDCVYNTNNLLPFRSLS